MAYDIEAKHYKELMNRLLSDEPEMTERLREVEAEDSGGKTLIIRTDPNRMTQKRNQVRRRYDKRRNWKR